MAKETTLHILRDFYIMCCLWHDLMPKSHKCISFALVRNKWLEANVVESKEVIMVEGVS